MITLANQKRFIGLTVSCLATIAPLTILSNGIALGQTAISVPSPAELATFRNKALADHNADRAINQVSALTTNPTLESGAQTWAEHLATTGTFEHSSSTQRNGAGENIYMSSTTDSTQPPATLAKAAVLSWYAEQGSYDFNTPGVAKNGTIGHFTQVVWKATTDLGCGTASVKEAAPVIIGGMSYDFYDYYVVCRYSPAGNLDGAYSENVFRPMPGTAAQP
jgi:uncharacterized protein YkwD